MSNFLSSIFSNLWQGLHGLDELGADVSSPGSTETLFQAGGPLVNVDGTPMLDSTIDVLGKMYGDSGSSFTGSTDPFGTGLHGSDW